MTTTSPNPRVPASLAALLCVAALFAAFPGIASGQGSTKERTALGTGGNDPFSLRARGGNAGSPTSTPTSVPEVAEPPKTSPKRAQSWAKDVLRLKSGEEPTGVLESFSYRTGAVLVGESEGESRRIPLTELSGAEICVSGTFQDGIEAFESGRRARSDAELRRALTLFQEARRSSDRRLEKEWATAKIAETLSALGRDDDACAEFFVLCRIEPYSAFFPSVPLRWVSSQPSGETADVAAQWLESKDNPLAALLAASVLTNSPKHEAKAQQILQNLVVAESADDANPDMAEFSRAVSLLAIAQLWRPDLLRSQQVRDLPRRRQTLNRIPGALRLGPESVVARLELKQGQTDETVPSLLRVAALSHDRTLARVCAKDAAGVLEKSGKRDAAEAATKLAGE